MQCQRHRRVHRHLRYRVPQPDRECSKNILINAEIIIINAEIIIINAKIILINAEIRMLWTARS